MIELLPDQFSTALPLFQATSYGALALSTLQGTHPGRVYVDRDTEPAAGLVCTRAGIGYYFLAGQPGESFLAWLREVMLHNLLPAQKVVSGDPVGLLFYDSPAWQEPLLASFACLGDGKMIDIRKKRLTLPPSDKNLHGWQEHLPPGCRVEPYTQALFEAHPELAGEVEFFYGSQEAFFQHGLGVCVLVNDQVACTCASVFTTCTEAEISIATAEPFRRRGLAFLAASAFISACWDRDLEPVWGCWPENGPSLTLAHKLGFVEQPDQPVCLLLTE